MKLAELTKHFFKDKDGHVVIFQWPNLTLYGWLVCKGLALFITKPALHAGFERLGTAFLFAWALLELTKGVNYFRRLLGLVVLVALVIGFMGSR